MRTDNEGFSFGNQVTMSEVAAYLADSVLSFPFFVLRFLTENKKGEKCDAIFSSSGR